MKITLITTTYNEQEHIDCFLNSLLTQSRRPDEIVIVDSASTDQTPQKIKNHPIGTHIKLRLISKRTTRSQGRNLAIKKAKHNIIAVSDVGCMPDKHWLERLTKPIVDNLAESVAGYYLPITGSYFQKALAPFVAVLPRNLNPETYLPSSRSVSFTKQAWEKAGKYPKHLNYCEDLVFARNLKEHTLMTVRQKAFVYWLQKSTFPEFFHQIKNYAQGDVEAGYWPHIKKISTVFVRYGAFFALPQLFLLYLFYPILKHSRDVDNFLSLLYLPPLQITSDFAVMAGSLLGLKHRYFAGFPISP